MPVRTLTLAAVVVCALALAGPATAAASCGLVGHSTTCTFSFTGGEQKFVVPAGIHSLSVSAIGGQGGGAGGPGARVSGHLAVTPGDTFYVEVGGTGGDPRLPVFGGGGGAGASRAGPGGGASDVRTVSCGAPSCDLLGTGSLRSRLLIAGGGGGAGGDSAVSGGPGGGAGINQAGNGAAGGSGAYFPGDLWGAGGGGGATSTAGGRGGGGTSRPDAVSGGTGTTGVAGAGGPGGSGDAGNGGGGGGGGLFGGGGGGGGYGIRQFAGTGGGGGGAGSSLVPAGGSIATDTTGTPSVKITYTSPAVSLSSSSFGFQPTVIGQSVHHTITLKNSGGLPLTVSGVSVSGSQFSAASACGHATIAPGHSCAIDVTYQPTTVGAASAHLTIRDNAPDSPQTVALTGEGVPVAITPSHLHFGAVAVGTRSAPLTATVQNTGPHALIITDIHRRGDHPGDFGVGTTCLEEHLASSATCTVTVSFRPGAHGSRTANVRLRDSATGDEHWLHLAGTGTE